MAAQRFVTFRFLFGLSAIIMVAANAVKSEAHDAHFILSSVEWNPDTKAIEVIHRFHAHHALDAIALWNRAAAPSFDNPESLSLLRAHLEKSFALKSASDDIVPLAFVGAELEGDFLLIYQESAPMAQPQSLKIKDDFLADIFEDQVSHVNVSLNGPKETLIFSRNRRGVFLQDGTGENAAHETP